MWCVAGCAGTLRAGFKGLPVAINRAGRLVAVGTACGLPRPLTNSLSLPSRSTPLFNTLAHQGSGTVCASASGGMQVMGRRVGMALSVQCQFMWFAMSTARSSSIHFPLPGPTRILPAQPRLSAPRRACAPGPAGCSPDSEPRLHAAGAQRHCLAAPGLAWLCDAINAGSVTPLACLGSVHPCSPLARRPLCRTLSW